MTDARALLRRFLLFLLRRRWRGLGWCASFFVVLLRCYPSLFFFVVYSAAPVPRSRDNWQLKDWGQVDFRSQLLQWGFGTIGNPITLSRILLLCTGFEQLTTRSSWTHSIFAHVARRFWVNEAVRQLFVFHKLFIQHPQRIRVDPPTPNTGSPQNEFKFTSLSQSLVFSRKERVLRSPLSPNIICPFHTKDQGLWCV